LSSLLKARKAVVHNRAARMAWDHKWVLLLHELTVTWFHYCGNK
jgi:hypothetical protein